MLMAFFSWWYGRGWQGVITSLQPRLHNIARNFSVAQLLKTLFAPWRRIITPSGRSLEDKLRAALDNLVSRVIGFIVRLGVLIAACLTFVVVGVLTVIEIIIWPLVPLAIPVCLVLGVIG